VKHHIDNAAILRRISTNANCYSYDALVEIAGGLIHADFSKCAQIVNITFVDERLYEEECYSKMQKPEKAFVVSILNDNDKDIVFRYDWRKHSKIPDWANRIAELMFEQIDSNFPTKGVAV
jgi:hypothetical protein